MARLTLYNVIEMNPQEQLKDERQSGHKEKLQVVAKRTLSFPN